MRLTKLRILICGVCGSGKTTFARDLARQTSIPWHSVDDLTHLPNWAEVSKDIQRQRIGAICDESEWILDSAYAKWIDIVLPRAELIIGLDYPRALSFYRLLRRTTRFIVDRTPHCNGNIDTWRHALSRESILLWHFKSFPSKRARIRQWQAEGRNIVAFQHPREAQRWLSQWTPD